MMSHNPTLGYSPLGPHPTCQAIPVVVGELGELLTSNHHSSLRSMSPISAYYFPERTVGARRTLGTYLENILASAHEAMPAASAEETPLEHMKRKASRILAEVKSAGKIYQRISLLAHAMSQWLWLRDGYLSRSMTQWESWSLNIVVSPSSWSISATWGSYS